MNNFIRLAKSSENNFFIEIHTEKYKFTELDVRYIDENVIIQDNRMYI